MTIREGDRLPEATLIRKEGTDPVAVSLSDLTRGRRVVIVGVPGAFTPTCHSAHMPTLISEHDAIKAKGVDEMIILAVNDMHVMKLWGNRRGPRRRASRCWPTLKALSPRPLASPSPTRAGA